MHNTNIKINFRAFLLCSLYCIVITVSATDMASAGERKFTITDKSLLNMRVEGLSDNSLNNLTELKNQTFKAEDTFLNVVQQKIGIDQTARYKTAILFYSLDDNNELYDSIQNLEHRVSNIESEKMARENASRVIIGDAIRTLGSNINESVSLNGSFEIVAGRVEDFSGNKAQQELNLNTVEINLGITANEWTKGNLTLTWDDGIGYNLPTGLSDSTNQKQLNIDTAYFTIGDEQRFALALTVGRITLPFGISNDNSVGDIISINDPLTTAVFGFKNTAIRVDFSFPRPIPVPQSPPVTPPPVKALVLKPVLSSLFKSLGYKSIPTKPLLDSYAFPPSSPPAFNMSLYSYAGSTSRNATESEYKTNEHYGAILGFQTKGNCNRHFDELVNSPFCHWGINLELNYISSIFDSQFLGTEYQDFSNQIGLVGGLSISQKVKLGPVLLIGELTSAVDSSTFADGLGKMVNIKPSAHQLSLIYQFDWNPWIEEIGVQGDYLTLSYSKSTDLAGVTAIKNGELQRVGFVPQQRYIVGMGEWVMDNVKVALEYNYNKDYPINMGGTGKSSKSVFIGMTVKW